MPYRKGNACDFRDKRENLVSFANFVVANQITFPNNLQLREMCNTIVHTHKSMTKEHTKKLLQLFNFARLLLISKAKIKKEDITPELMAKAIMARTTLLEKTIFNNGNTMKVKENTGSASITNVKYHAYISKIDGAITSMETYMQLGPSKVAGLGVLCLRDISAQTFIIEYTGELIDQNTWNIRNQKYKMTNSTYVFELRCSPKLFVDATCCGNLSRFVNHSCNPNLVAETVIHNGKPKVFFYSVKKISFGDEFFIDYGVVHESDTGIECKCGAKQCRKRLPS